MKNVFENTHGTSVVEFGLAAAPVLWFILGIMQIGWVAWIDNLLQVSVDAAARCGAIGSTTSPCKGSTATNMIQTANTVFGPLIGSFSANTSNCSGGVGLVGTYTITFLFVTKVTVTAKSCYPVVS